MCIPCSFATIGARKLNLGCPLGEKMAASNIERKALSLLNAFENAGKSVARVIVDGRRIELELSSPPDRDEFDRIDMRHGET